MAIRALTDSLCIDPVSVDSLFVDPVIDAGAPLHCAAATVAPACTFEEQRFRPQHLHLQQAMAVQDPQSQPGLRPEWVQARAALLAMSHQQCDETTAPELLDSSPRARLH
ncbi:hypothetical protein [Xanthomonas floridensis]|uniref:Uncharacterized protein n=1 Tax=Xanthomonas floridensis TaxID=1843580 RepID=A0A1A9MGC6_9XANT|nr:hypothetical protein [Xanthomonas floridensis]MEA5123646.1 hypothetical protein [Xanthomonas floridensis]MEA5130512.1 hypothetical protein [Xanthomonas floridensis]OAG69258.1 hypothetical protein A7D17_00050 [Xanthomonas floridensis]